MEKTKIKILSFFLGCLLLLLTFNVKIIFAAPGDPVPWDPAEKIAFISQGSLATIPTQLTAVYYNPDYSIYFSNIGDTTANVIYNALAYNTDDNFLYAIVKDVLGTTNPVGLKTGDLIKIGQNAEMVRVETIPGNSSTNTAAGANAGCYDPDNHIYYVWRDNLGGADPQYTDLFGIDTTTGAIVSQVSLSTRSKSQDFTYYNKYLWGMQNNGNGKASLVQVDPTTGRTNIISIPNLNLPNNDGEQFGAAWTLGNGELMFSNNDSGNIYRVNVSVGDDGKATINGVIRHSGPANNSNDGANMFGVVPPVPPPPVPPVGTKSVSDSDEFDSTGVSLKDNLETFLYKINYSFGTGMTEPDGKAIWENAIISDDLSTVVVHGANVSDAINFIPGTAKIYDENGNDVSSTGAFTTDDGIKLEFTLNKDPNTNDYSYLFKKTYTIEVFAQVKPDATDDNLITFINSNGIPNQATLIIFDDEGNISQMIYTNVTTVIPIVLPKTGEEYNLFFKWFEKFNNSN